MLNILNGYWMDIEWSARPCNNVALGCSIFWMVYWMDIEWSVRPCNNVAQGCSMFWIVCQGSDWNNGLVQSVTGYSISIQYVMWS